MTMTFRKATLFWVGLSIALLFWIGPVLFGSPYRKNQTSLVKATAMAKATAQKIVQLLIQAGYPNKLAKIIAAQSAFETGFFTSVLAVKYSNYFGMMSAGWQNRPNVQLYGKVWCVPQSLSDSVDIQVKYLNRRKLPLTITTVSDFVDAISQWGYFGNDPKQVYEDGLKADYKAIFES